MPRAGRRTAHRCQSRVALEARFRPLGRYAAGHGRLGDGVSAGLQGAGVRSGRRVDEVEQYAGHGRRLSSLGRSDGRRRYALSDSSGRYRGRKRHRGAHQERRGHRGADGRRHRRYDPRFADRSARKRNPRRRTAGEAFRPAAGQIPRTASRTLFADRIPPPYERRGAGRPHRAAGGLLRDRSRVGESDGRTAGCDPEPRHAPARRGQTPLRR